MDEPRLNTEEQIGKVQKSLNSLVEGGLPTHQMGSGTTVHYNIYVQGNVGAVGNSSSNEGVVGTDVIQSPQGAYQTASKTVTSQERQQRSKTVPVFETPYDVEDWFFSLPEDVSIDYRLHVLTVAFFGGNSVRFIERLKFELKEMLKLEDATPPSEKPKAQDKEQEAKDEGSKPRKPSYRMPLEATSRSLWLYTGTQLEPRRIVVNGVPASVDVLVFKDDRSYQSVVAFFRASPDLAEARQAFEMLFLKICYSSDDELVSKWQVAHPELARNQAALGIGELVRGDYAYYQRNFINVVIEKLFISPSTATMVGWIMYRMATDPENRDSAFLQVEKWIQKKDIAYQIIGVMCCIQLGYADVRRTIELIGRNIHEINPLVRLLIGTVIAVLFKTSTHAPVILSILSFWVRIAQEMRGNEKIQLRSTYALVFFVLLVSGDKAFNSSLTIEQSSLTPKKNINSPSTAGEGRVETHEANEGLKELDATTSREDVSDYTKSSKETDSPSKIQRNELQSKDALNTLWGMIVYTKQNNPQATIEQDIADLVSACFGYQSNVAFSNMMYSVMEKWLVEAEKATHSAIKDSIYRIICGLKRGKHSRHINFVVNRAKFNSSSFVRHLRQC